jgi:DnaJ family protein C protein 9
MDEYEKKYKYSDQEKQDVYGAYLKSKGDLLNMIDIVPLSNYDDLERFRAIIEEAIAAGELQPYKAFKKGVTARELKKRLKIAEEESREVQGLVLLTAEQEVADTQSLEVLIREKNTNRMQNLIASLEAKAKSERQLKRKKNNEPTEEEFQAIQSKMKTLADVNENKKSKKSKKIENIEPKPSKRRLTRSNKAMN